MSDSRIIKKYPNRRLYDTAISSYITLEDVKRLVLERATFRVIDARSGDDLTRSILLQIISEQEEQGNPIFSTEVLAHIIRFYGDTMQGMMGRYLEESLQMFVDQQHLLREQMRSLNPLSMMSGLAEQNMNIWKSMQDGFYKPGAEGFKGMPQVGGKPQVGKPHSDKSPSAKTPSDKTSSDKTKSGEEPAKGQGPSSPVGGRDKTDAGKTDAAKPKPAGRDGKASKS